MRILHTADWQLGLRLGFIPEQKDRHRAQSLRFEALRTLADLAKRHHVDAVVVCGDVFDDNEVGPDVVQQAVDMLRRFGPTPVALLPGNHDAATPDSVLKRLPPMDHLHILTTPEPLTLGRLVLHPCPLTKRIRFTDPTAELSPASEDGRFHLVMAHGGTIDLDPENPASNAIDLPRLLQKGYDYIALGDWHSLKEMDQRAWYPGAPEATRFKELDPGKALLVELKEPGGTPSITPVKVARSRWIKAAIQIDSDEDITQIETLLEGLETRSETLVQLTLNGQITLEGRARLETLLQLAGEQLLYLRLRMDHLMDAPSEEQAEWLQMAGVIGRVAERLEEEALRDPGSSAQDARRLLHRLMWEIQNDAS
ncbi:MAG: DNA repair exonuclease [Magnetococcales bacterium]|nr:DNA repair exonuclease [Magnetococcales bacterium]